MWKEIKIMEREKKIYVYGNQNSRIGFRTGYHHVKS